MREVELCGTCGAQGQEITFEGGRVISFPCTAEIVVTSDGQRVTVKRCPDWSGLGRTKGVS